MKKTGMRSATAADHADCPTVFSFGFLPKSSKQGSGASIEVSSLCFVLQNSTVGQQLLSLL